MSKGSELVTGEIRLQRVEECLWEIPRQGGMRVPGRIYASEKLLAGLKEAYSLRENLDYREEGGRLETADAELVSDRALERGLKQVGTLGSGNHFLEIGRVDE